MTIEFNNDKPITSVKEDRFGRSQFAKKLTTLCGNYTSKSTVIGLYGKWGEGKTSLLNMVSESLDTNILQIHFNPWYFKDEEQLLQAFFQLLADKLQKSLNTRKEKINNLISEYGESIGVLATIPQVSIVAQIIRSISKLFKEIKKPTTEIARNRINNFIIDSGISIVIFIDDIDRLDTKEVTTIFRLVKLLADFPRTTYILSFDVDIVARMLAPSYGGIIPESGYQYLEKVIQVPLPIPKAHDDSTLSFAQKTIREVAIEVGMDLEKENEQLDEIFADGLLMLLNNPRKIIRFGNAFRFTYPILKGEVNPMDLLIVEAFKASLPEYYNFIRMNKEIFLQDYFDENQNQYENTRDNAAHLVNSLLNSYSQKVRSVIYKLTSMLFPRFIWTNVAEVKSQNKQSLVVLKRICTEDYFDRYFTFAVQPQEIPDTHFYKYYLNTDNLSVNQVADQITRDFETFSTATVAFKLADYRDTLGGESATKLALALCMVSDKIGERRNFQWGNPFALITLTVVSIIRALPQNQSFQLAKEIVLSPTSLPFAAELTARFVMPESKEKLATLFTGNQAKEIKKRYISRLKTLIDEKGFFEAIPEAAMLRQLVWWQDIESQHVRKIISDLLNNNPEAPLKILRIFTPTLYTQTESGKTDTIKADFTIDDFLRMEAMTTEMDRIYHLLSKQYGDLSRLPTVDTAEYEEALDDRTLIGKFQHLYHLRTGTLLSVVETPQKES